MLDIKHIKTRDTDVLNETIRNMMDLDKGCNPVGDMSILVECVERIPDESHMFYNQEIKCWVFTNVYDDYIVSQDFFNQEQFVIVEKDLNMALARGIHYRYHKKLRE